jgi:hypothetical protein
VSHWLHNMLIVRSRGLWKATCSCGWQSKRAASEEQVKCDYQAHTKLVEKEPKRGGEE